MILNVFYIDFKHFKSYVSDLQITSEIREKIMIFTSKYVNFSLCFSSSVPGANILLD